MGLMKSCLPFPQEIPTVYMDVAEYVAEYIVEYDAEYIAQDVAYGKSEVHRQGPEAKLLPFTS